MFIQLVCGLLSGISITVLKDAYGAFARATYLDELRVVGFVQPIKDVLADFVPLYWDRSVSHFYLQQAKDRLDCMLYPLAAKVVIGKELFPAQLFFQRRSRWGPGNSLISSILLFNRE